MLVFQKEFDHIRQRLRERTRVDVPQMLETVARINLYLPDDWRMTEKGNEFSVLVSSPSGSYILCGSSYRSGPCTVLNIVDTIGPPNFVHPRLLPDTVGKHESLDRHVRRQNPEMLTPNLYLFRPRPDDSPSPLFARQYEKVKQDRSGEPVGTQYHRIHPLTKDGLDALHYRWVRWDITGHVEFADYPEPGYHGKDYWAVPLLSEDKWRGRADDYRQAYEAVLAEHGVTAPAPPEGAPTPYEDEFKLRCEPSGSARKTLEDTLLLVQSLGLTVRDVGRPREQTDVYFDDEQLALYRRGVSFRLRKKPGCSLVTLKARPVGPQATVPAAGRYRRIEEEVAVSREQEGTLLEGRPVQVLPYRLIAYVAPDCGCLREVLCVVNRRTLVLVANESQQTAEVCVDQVRYVVGGKGFGPDVEVEVESKGLPRQDVEALAALLQEELGLRPSAQTKYERGLGLAGLLP